MSLVLNSPLMYIILPPTAQKYLAREVKNSPVEAIRFYSLMHDRLSDPRFYYEDQAKEIIRVGMFNQTSCKDTISLADKIFRRGNYEFQLIIDDALAKG